jgi:hypothetical protein
MGGIETELEMVRRHVQDGERHIAGQHARIARLAASELSTEAAETFLVLLETLQRQHEAHLARLTPGANDR